MILYVGTYTEILVDDFGGHAEGIYCYDFNEETGELQHLHTTPTRNPSYLCLDSRRMVLYAVEEVFMENNPKLHAFKIRIDHSLELMNTLSVPGGLPCHLEIINQDIVLVACYENGHVAGFSTHEDGRLNACCTVIQHLGKSINPERQSEAHAHMISQEKSTKKIAVCDLGLDEIRFYHLNKEREKLLLQKEDTVKIPAGKGPRHLAYHPSGEYAFVLNELSSCITLLKKIDNKWTVQSSNPALPGNDPAKASGSAIRVHPSGRFVYGGNRGTHSITIFSFDTENGTLQFLEHQDSGGKTPREFNLSPDGRWLLVAHQDSDSIVVFKIDPETGLLKKRNTYPVQSPVCLRWKNN